MTTVPKLNPATNKLVPYTDPILITPTINFDFDAPPEDPGEFAKELVETMTDLRGLGLSAVQIGKPYKIFSMRSNPAFVCFNPRIVDVSSVTETLEEGCLSFPGIHVKVERPQMIKVRFQLPSGETVTEKFSGMTARIFCHEMDHGNGILFFDKLGRAGLELQVRKAKAAGFSYDVGKLVVLARKSNANRLEVM